MEQQAIANAAAFSTYLRAIAIAAAQDPGCTSDSLRGLSKV
jgi:hypothetical protein